MKLFQWILIIFSSTACYSQQVGKDVRYIEVSKSNASYFAFSDGSPYIPVGINMINPSGRYRDDPDSAFYEIEDWMKNLSANGGNYVRIWLSQSFWDIEEDKAGHYDEQKAARIDRFIQMARKYKLRIKLTLEHFRSITMEENPQRWATKFSYHKSQGGPLDSVSQYLTTTHGQLLFLDKVNYYQKRYGTDTLFFGWELWNEMNAMSLPRDSVFIAWNEKMLAAVKTRFPSNLVMQSLGSFDDEDIRPLYKKITGLPANEVAQIHRYLDLGAEMKICQAPMDIICASAIRELQSYRLNKPVILAETGAVEPRHAGPSRYYAVDTAGILLHDILFAPFFSGSAGPGMSWHWESYVHKNNLWYHYGRFSQVIRGIDPVAESFQPSVQETDLLRIYTLKGKKTTLIWLRDKMNNWESELEKRLPPGIIHGMSIDLPKTGASGSFHKVEIYDPWKDKWTTIRSGKSTISLPDFRRSIILRLTSE